jgi:hypothetical protein
VFCASHDCNSKNIWSEVRDLDISIMINSDDNPFSYAKFMMPRFFKLYCFSDSNAVVKGRDIRR